MAPANKQEKQWRWIQSLANHIPRLFADIENGEVKAKQVIGKRVVDGRTIEVALVAEVVDNGVDPLRNHASTHYPSVEQNQASKPIERSRTQRRRATLYRKGLSK